MATAAVEKARGRHDTASALAPAAATTGSLLLATPLCASVADDQVEALFMNTCVGQTRLVDDVTRVETDQGVVILLRPPDPFCSARTPGAS